MPANATIASTHAPGMTRRARPVIVRPVAIRPSHRPARMGASPTRPLIGSPTSEFDAACCVATAVTFGRTWPRPGSTNIASAITAAAAAPTIQPTARRRERSRRGASSIGCAIGAAVGRVDRHIGGRRHRGRDAIHEPVRARHAWSGRALRHAPTRTSSSSARHAGDAARRASTSRALPPRRARRRDSPTATSGRRRPAPRASASVRVTSLMIP